MKIGDMSFPADIKGCMKDCILSLFWPRKDNVSFFEKHGCTKAEIAPLQIEGENCWVRIMWNATGQVSESTGAY